MPNELLHANVPIFFKAKHHLPHVIPQLQKKKDITFPHTSSRMKTEGKKKHIVSL